MTDESASLIDRIAPSANEKAILAGIILALIPFVVFALLLVAS